MWWLIVVGAVLVLTSFFMLLKPKKEQSRQRAGGTSRSYALERRNTALTEYDREVRYESRGNEGFVHIKSSKPMHRIRIYIRTGVDHLFAYKVDDDEE
jgi:hypothetical protein